MGEGHHRYVWYDDNSKLTTLGDFASAFGQQRLEEDI